MPSFKAITTQEAEAFRAGAPDAYGNPAERAVSPGVGTPCRHCLKHIPKDQDMLILAYKPFDGSHPYAEYDDDEQYEPCARSEHADDHRQQ